MINVEICVDSPDDRSTLASVDAAWRGGAVTVELCGKMNLGGLTPETDRIAVARDAFRNRPGLMVMIRPRDGDFFFSEEEADVMINQIGDAAENGADGVVFGTIDRKSGRIDRTMLGKLADAAAVHGLSTTFHRAFDAAPDPYEALDVLMEYGIERVLTSGTPWGSGGTALDGADVLANLVKRSGGRIEIVIGGGVSSSMIPDVLKRIPLDVGPVAVHAYSSVLKDGLTDEAAVRKLEETVRPFV